LNLRTFIFKSETKIKLNNMLNTFTKLIAVTITSALLMGCASLSAQTDRDDYREQAIEILESVPLFDGHNDAPLQYRNRAGYKFSELDFYDTTHLERSMHTDIERLREGRVGAQWWSVYVSANLPEPEAVKQTMEQVEFVHRMAQQYPDVFEIAHTADDVERIFAEGKIASLMGMEGGHSINNSLGVLRMFHELGVRYMTLTHGRTLDWADAAGDEQKHDGLSAFGEEVVREMNRLGMAVDLSHVTPATMKDAIRVSEAPVMFSHSNARAISNHPRNVPNDVIQLLPQKDGLVMVTFVESFTSEELRQWYAERSGYLAKMESLYPGQPDIIEEMMDEWTDENEMPKSTLEQVADHIDHIRDQVGVDHIGIGGDYDGISSLPTGLDDVSTYPNLFAELLKRGYSEEDLRKIAGENMLRVMRGVEATAERLQNERGPSEALITDFD
jgi:membrane dipeptidase